jgi:hypothetical protein
VPSSDSPPSATRQPSAQRRPLAVTLKPSAPVPRIASLPNATPQPSSQRHSSTVYRLRTVAAGAMPSRTRPPCRRPSQCCAVNSLPSRTYEPSKHRRPLSASATPSCIRPAFVGPSWHQAVNSPPTPCTTGLPSVDRRAAECHGNAPSGHRLAMRRSLHRWCGPPTRRILPMHVVMRQPSDLVPPPATACPSARLCRLVQRRHRTSGCHCAMHPGPDWYHSALHQPYRAQRRHVADHGQ